MDGDSQIKSFMGQRCCTMGRNLGPVHVVNPSANLFQVYSRMGNRNDGNIIRTSSFVACRFLDRLFELCRLSAVKWQDVEEQCETIGNVFLCVRTLNRFVN